MAELCSPHRIAGKVLGCAFRFVHSLTGEVRCYIYIAPREYLLKHGVIPAQIRRHEIGHCNGGHHVNE
jgi:hypothetical protein